MALSVTQKSQMYRGFEGDGLKLKFLTLDLGVYATNGIAFAAANANMEVLYDLIFGDSITANIHKVRYSLANKKIVAYGDSVNQVANDTNLTGQKINAIAIGY